MAKKNEVAGVTAKRKRPIVIPVADDPENQWISKADFLKKRAAQKKAKAAGEEAKQRVLDEAGIGKAAPKEAKPTPGQEKLQKLRKDLANAESKLAGSPGSKSWAAKVKALSEELEVAESEAE